MEQMGVKCGRCPEIIWEEHFRLKEQQAHGHENMWVCSRNSRGASPLEQRV